MSILVSPMLLNTVVFQPAEAYQDFNAASTSPIQPSPQNPGWLDASFLSTMRLPGFRRSSSSGTPINLAKESPSEVSPMFPSLLHSAVFNRATSPELEEGLPLSSPLSAFLGETNAVWLSPKFAVTTKRESLDSTRCEPPSSKQTTPFFQPSAFANVGLGIGRPPLARSWDSLAAGTSTFGDGASCRVLEPVVLEFKGAAGHKGEAAVVCESPVGSSDGDIAWRHELRAFNSNSFAIPALGYSLMRTPSATLRVDPVPLKELKQQGEDGDTSLLTNLNNPSWQVLTGGEHCELKD